MGEKDDFVTTFLDAAHGGLLKLLLTMVAAIKAVVAIAKGGSYISKPCC